MVNNLKMLPDAILKKLISFIFSLVLLAAFVFAETENNSADKAEQNETAAVNPEETEPEEIVWQTLEWEEENPEYVIHYDIDIERYDDKKKEYVPQLSLKTEDNSTSINIEPQLTAGIYRYKITSYDLLGFASAESEWNDLIIYKAYEPEITGVSSAVNYSSTIYLEEFNDGIFNISGKNLFETPETGKEISFTNYFLRAKNKKSSGSVPLILEISPDNKKVKIQLKQEQMETGTYYIVARDASGLESPLKSGSVLEIKYKKAMDLNVSIGYSVPYILYDDTFPTYMNGKIWPISATPKITFIPPAALCFGKHRWGFLGFGITGTYTRMNADFGDYTISGNMMSGFFNLVYQKPIYKKVSDTQRKHFMTFELHAGGGTVIFKDYVFSFPHDIKSKALNSAAYAMDAGFALQYYFTSRLYAEADINYVHAIGSDISLGMIIPTVSIGWQF